MRLSACEVLVTLMLIAIPAAAVEYPVSVPLECVQLARREGHPLTIESRAQAVRSQYKLFRLDPHDPLVHQCREAVGRLQAKPIH